MESSDAHRINEGLVLHALVAVGANSRQHIARTTGLSKATVSRVVRQLIEAGLVVEGALVSGPDGGRATQTLEFTGATELVCGVDVGGTNTRFVVIDQQARMVEAWRVSTIQGRTGARIASWIVAQIEKRCPAVERLGLAATVIGVPGVVVPVTNSVEQAPNLPGMAGASFHRQLSRKLPGDVVIANDSNVALRGEMLAGAASGARDVVMVTLGTGVGAGVALNGQLLNGARGLVGEFGLLPVALDGTTVEDVLSGNVMRTDSDFWQPNARALRALFALCMAVTIAYDPEVIVFGGRVSEAIGPALAAVQELMTAKVASAPRLVQSHLGDAAGAIGAAGSALAMAYESLGLTPQQADGLGSIPAIQKLSEAVVTRLETGSTKKAGHEAVARGVNSDAHPGVPISSRK